MLLYEILKRVFFKIILFLFFFSGAGFAKPSGLANAWPTTGSAKRQVALPRSFGKRGIKW